MSRVRMLVELSLVSWGFLLGTLLVTLGFWSGRLVARTEYRILRQAVDSLSMIVEGRGVCWAPQDTIRRRTREALPFLRP